MAKSRSNTKKKASAPEGGGLTVADLAAHVEKVTKKSYSTRELRVLLRRLAKDGTIKRRKDEGRKRYSWPSAKDPEFRAIVDAVKSGSVEKERDEALSTLRQRKKGKKPTTESVKTSKSRATKKSEKKTKPRVSKKEEPTAEELEQIELEEEAELSFDD